MNATLSAIIASAVPPMTAPQAVRHLVLLAGLRQLGQAPTEPVDGDNIDALYQAALEASPEAMAKGKAETRTGVVTELPVPGDLLRLGYDVMMVARPAATDFALQHGLWVSWPFYFGGEDQWSLEWMDHAVFVLCTSVPREVKGVHPVNGREITETRTVNLFSA